jgi:hypothetical protein
MGAIYGPETSVLNHLTLHKNPKDGTAVEAHHHKYVLLFPIWSLSLRACRIKISTWVVDCNILAVFTLCFGNLDGRRVGLKGTIFSPRRASFNDCVTGAENPEDFPLNKTSVKSLKVYTNSLSTEFTISLIRNICPIHLIPCHPLAILPPGFCLYTSAKPWYLNPYMAEHSP